MGCGAIRRTCSLATTLRDAIGSHGEQAPARWRRPTGKGGAPVVTQRGRAAASASTISFPRSATSGGRAGSSSHFASMGEVFAVA